MSSINGGCESCYESNGTIMCGMTRCDGQPGNYTFRPYSPSTAFLPVRSHCANARRDRC